MFPTNSRNVVASQQDSVVVPAVLRWPFEEPHPLFVGLPGILPRSDPESERKREDELRQPTMEFILSDC